MHDASEHDDVDDGRFECWCGVAGTFDELFDESGLPPDGRCGGLGVLFCECGGDGICVCHFHGQTDCDGCEDCDADDDFDHVADPWADDIDDPC